MGTFAHFKVGPWVDMDDGGSRHRGVKWELEVWSWPPKTGLDLKRAARMGTGCCVDDSTCKRMDLCFAPKSHRREAQLPYPVWYGREGVLYGSDESTTGGAGEGEMIMASKRCC